MSDDQQKALDRKRHQIASALTSIEQHYPDLHEQALASASDPDFPGGLALSMLGPVGDPAVLQRRSMDHALGWVTWEDADEQVLTDKHPQYVLWQWTRIIREERDQPTDLKSTLSREVAYLRGSLDWMLRLDEYGEPEWPEADDLLSDLRGVVR